MVLSPMEVRVATKQDIAFKRWVRSKGFLLASRKLEDGKVNEEKLAGLNASQVYDLLIEAFVAGYDARRHKKPKSRYHT